MRAFLLNLTLPEMTALQIVLGRSLSGNPEQIDEAYSQEKFDAARPVATIVLGKLNKAIAKRAQNEQSP